MFNLNKKNQFFLKTEIEKMELKIQKKLQNKSKFCFENSTNAENFENCILPLYKKILDLENGFGSIFAFTEIYSKICFEEFDHEEYCKDTTRDMFIKKIDVIFKELEE